MSAHHKTSASIAFNKKMRALFAPQMPMACGRCGHPIVEGQAWHVGHILDIALGGTDTPDNVRPEHKRCNERAGGQLGARIANAHRQQKTSYPNW
jgi:hypothetical protein